MPQTTNRQREFQTALMAYVGNYRRANAKPVPPPTRDWIAPLFARLTSMVVTTGSSQPNQWLARRLP